VEGKNSPRYGGSGYAHPVLIAMTKHQTKTLLAEAYTHSALSAVIAAATETHTDWIAEILEWNMETAQW